MNIDRRLQRLSPAKLRLLARELEDSERGERTTDAAEPIAIVGLACRMPGGANDPESFWALLREGRDANVEIPSRRWNKDAFYHSDPERTGRSYVRRGYFLSDIDQFDPAFFGISRREAAAMDPQQRLLLEVTWEAIERAGYAPVALAESKTGIFVGAYGDEYIRLQVWNASLDDIDGYTAVSTSHAAAVGRVAHVLALRGPCLAIDTACSSSLVAVHLACESLRRRESDQAIAGGVSLAISPETLIALCRARMLSPDGRCKTFDATADGYGRGEGCGIILLKRLEDAVIARDNVLAVIRGSAVNHDGRSSTLTAPNGPAQAGVIRRALAEAGIKPEAVDHIEAHGTGTPLGDPIEIEALAGVFATTERAGRSLIVSSVKTNIGHLEAAAGIAGLIKVVLSLQAQEIPGHLHLRELNPNIQPCAIEFPEGIRQWPAGERPRIAGVSSFGFGGTNAHVVVGETPSDAAGPIRSEARRDSERSLVLSARSEEELDVLAQRFLDRLGELGDEKLGDAAFTANAGRKHHPHRVAFAAESTAKACGAISDFLARRESGAWTSGSGKSPARPVFLFTGQGSQYAQMGKDLLEGHADFRETFLRCDELLRPILGESIADVIMKGDPRRLDDTSFTQPALFAFECALAAAWKAWGVEPAAVMGHSVGEYVAAYVAGVFDLETGLRLIAERGRLMQQLPRGAMAAVLADEDRVRRVLADGSFTAGIAAVNGPGHVVVSGSAEQVEMIVGRFERDGTSVRRLPVSHAFHSPMMQPMLDAFGKVLRESDLRAPRLPLFSNVTGNVAGAEMASADYWLRHVLEPVLFSSAIKAAVDGGWNLFLEVGPSAVLSPMAQRCVEDRGPTWLSSLRRGRPERATLAEVARELYVRGAPIRWDAVHAGHGGRRISLPTYPFRREKCWLPAVERGLERLEEKALDIAQQRGPFLGRRLRLGTGSIVFEARYSLSTPTLSDHRLFGEVVVPGACYAATMLAAAREVMGEHVTLDRVVFSRPLVLAHDGAQYVQTIVEPSAAVNGSEGTSSLPADADVKVVGSPAIDRERFLTHAQARVRRQADAVANLDADFATLEGRCCRHLSGEQFYEVMARCGFELGPSFQWLTDLRIGEREATARMNRPSADQWADLNPVVPSLLDACFQLVAAVLADAKDGLADDELFVPVSVDVLDMRPCGDAELHAHAELLSGTAQGEDIAANIRVFDGDGRAVITVTGLRAHKVSRAALRLHQGARNRSAYVVDWPEKQLNGGGASPAGRWLVVGAAELGGRLAQRIQTRRGASCVFADAAETLHAIGCESFDGVVLAVDDSAATYASGEALLAAQRATTGLALELAQRLARRERAGRLWIVTRGAVAIDDGESVVPSCAPLWGLGRVVALEHPRVWGGIIDLDRERVCDRDMDVVADWLARAEGEAEVAVRNGCRHVARLRRAGDSPSRELIVAADATYLVSGGLGALGSLVGEWLVARGARTVALVGRSQPSVEVSERIRSMERRGARVSVIQADVSRQDDVTRFMRDVRQRLPPLRGIVHSAGVLHDALMLDQTWDTFTTVMAPKVAGAFNLHLATLEAKLDFFVLFSSAAALLGSPGQANYAAANAFLDGLAFARRSLGLPALSIDWGPWADVGMAANRKLSSGALLTRILPNEGLRWMEDALAQDRPQLGLVSIDWSRWQADEQETPALVSELVRRTGVPEKSNAPVLDLTVEQVIALPASQRQSYVAGKLQKELARVLGVAIDEVDPSQSIHTLGLDSIASIELKNRIERRLSVMIPVASLLRGPSLNELSTQLLRLLDARLLSENGSSQESSSPTPVPETIRELSQLDDAQVDALLSSMMAGASA